MACINHSLKILYFEKYRFAEQIVLRLKVDYKNLYAIFNGLCKPFFSIKTKIFANYKGKKESRRKL